MKKIKLMADYECYPLWVDSDNEFGNIDPDSLPISELLKSELNNWSDAYDKTLNPDNPLESGFKSINEKIAFKEKGKYLQEKLQIELGKTCNVVYQP